MPRKVKQNPFRNKKNIEDYKKTSRRKKTITIIERSSAGNGRP